MTAQGWFRNCLFSMQFSEKSFFYFNGAHVRLRLKESSFTCTFMGLHMRLILRIVSRFSHADGINMGYEFHITRKDNWYDEDGPEITLDEWLAVVSDDPEMRLDGQAKVQLPGGRTLRTEDESMAVWTAYSEHNEHGTMVWMWRSSLGNVDAKNSDGEIIQKMCRIAQRLSAKVQGDESECYGLDGNVIPESVPKRVYPQERKPWWRFW
jgi:hypothetical protein